MIVYIIPCNTFQSTNKGGGVGGLMYHFLKPNQEQYDKTMKIRR